MVKLSPKGGHEKSIKGAESVYPDIKPEPRSTPANKKRGEWNCFHSPHTNYDIVLYMNNISGITSG